MNNELAGWLLSLVLLVLLIIMIFLERSNGKMVSEGTVLLRAANDLLEEKERQDQIRVLRAVRDGTFDKVIGPDHPDYRVFRELVDCGAIKANVITEGKVIH